MEYAIEILVLIIGGLVLGNWLTEHFGLNPIWTVILPILGMVAGIALMYRRFSGPAGRRPYSSLSGSLPGKGAQTAKRVEKPPEPAEKTRLPVESLDFLYRKQHEEPQKGNWSDEDEDDPEKEDDF